ncbi:MAG: hypothetical protein JSW40_00405 [Candidatus Omnitrophota bacterium]|nr:MAG: hypothetical protein JSW40_00405 [Candidatus Omnitrophota bacterium]
MNKVKIGGDNFRLEFNVEFFDNPTAKAILDNLPLQSKARLWGDEIYFDIGIDAPPQNLTLDVASQDIAYWPQGKCLCVFFGPTPASSGSKPVPASEVVVVGKAQALPADLKKVKSGYKIRVE